MKNSYSRYIPKLKASLRIAAIELYATHFEDEPSPPKLDEWVGAKIEEWMSEAEADED